MKRKFVPVTLSVVLALGAFAIGCATAPVSPSPVPPSATPTLVSAAPSVSVFTPTAIVPTASPIPSRPQTTVISTAPSVASTPRSAASPVATAGGLGPRATVPPVVTSTIHFDFSSPIAPLGDSKVVGIVVDPTDANLWYVSGQNGLYITRDGGISWTVNKTIVTNAIILVPQNTKQVYAGVKEVLYGSEDKGQNWKVIGKFDAGTSIRSLHVGRDGTIFVGLHWADFKKPGTTPEGIYISRDQGATWQFSSFASPHRGLIIWAIDQDPLDGTLYAGTEISTHPTPYHPPFFRSRDGGKTWEDISGILDWHVVVIQVHPVNGYLFALTEGRGLYGSSDHGDHWKLLSGNVALTMLLDSNYPNRLFGSAFSNALGQYGGVFSSTNSGASFEQIGLPGVRATSLALNGDSTSLYAVIQGSGIVVSKIP